VAGAASWSSGAGKATTAVPSARLRLPRPPPGRPRSSTSSSSPSTPSFSPASFSPSPSVPFSSFASSSSSSPSSAAKPVSSSFSSFTSRVTPEAEGAELPEDELLGWLREQGLITYPSPLLEGLLGGELPEVLAAKVLPQLDPTDVAMFGRVCQVSRATVVVSGLQRAGTGAGLPLQLEKFIGSVERLSWLGGVD